MLKTPHFDRLSKDVSLLLRLFSKTWLLKKETADNRAAFGLALKSIGLYLYQLGHIFGLFKYLFEGLKPKGPFRMFLKGLGFRL